MNNLTDVYQLKEANRLLFERHAEMEELLRSAHAIALRKGEGTHWERFAASIQKLGIGSVTARTYRVLEIDKPDEPKATQ